MASPVESGRDIRGVLFNKEGVLLNKEQNIKKSRLLEEQREPIVIIAIFTKSLLKQADSHFLRKALA